MYSLYLQQLQEAHDWCNMIRTMNDAIEDDLYDGLY